MAIAAGTRFGAYEIAALIGAGAMGEVYRAVDTRLHRTVAIKVLSGTFDSDPDRLRRFMQEAEATGRVNHPNIVAVYDVGTQDGAPFIVSELLEGETLRERLARGRVPPSGAIRWAAEVSDGLAAAHERGVVHRDLKPDNLFLTTDGRIKIVDFGLARLSEPSEAQAALANVQTKYATRTGTVLGTPGYMAPEQLQGRPADARADVFALGAILHEMLTGRRAFDGATPLETMHATVHADPSVLPADVDAAVPGVHRVLRRAMAKEPSERFQSTRDFGFAIADLAAASPGAGGRRGGRAMPSPRTAMIAGIVLAIAAAVVFLTVWKRAGGSSGPRAGASIHSIAVLPLENLSHDPLQDFFSDGMTAALITDFAKVSSLRVISRTSIMRYKGATKALPEIARELNVDAIVAGSVIRVGDDVRIDAQLIRGLAELEKGFQHRADCMVWMETDPKLDIVRKMPEFQALRKKMGLPGA